MNEASEQITLAMAELFRKRMSLREIGAVFGVTKQAVQSRLGRAGIRYCRKYQTIDKERLQELYTIDKKPKREIARAFGSDCQVIDDALEFHKIPKREPIKWGGVYADFLRTIGLGEKKELTPKAKFPHAQLHRAATAIGIKISMKAKGAGKFEITRIG